MTCLRAFVPSCITRLHASRGLLTRLIYAPCATYLCLKIFLEWVCSPVETFHFPRTIKGTTDRAVSCGSTNSRETF